jgi:uncharacterized protein
VASRLAAALAGAGAGLAAWGLFESQWLETRELDVPVAGLPPALDGLALLHLSDFHAGTPSFNTRTMRRAIDFGVQVRPDLVAITGDLVSHPRALAVVRDELARLDPPLGIYAVTGNHELGASGDPFSRGLVVEDWAPARVQLLRDRMVALEWNGQRIEVAGEDAAAALSDAISSPQRLFDDPASVRILLTHFPDTAERLVAGDCSLVLSGHLHGGQICLPLPGGKLRLAHTAWKFDEGVFEQGTMTVVVSRGTGTTLLPLRLCARPEASLLRLRPAGV